MKTTKQATTAQIHVGNLKDMGRRFASAWNRAANTRELATSIERDYKNVYQDVAALENAGLLLREGRKLTAPWDELRASVALA